MTAENQQPQQEDNKNEEKVTMTDADEQEVGSGSNIVKRLSNKKRVSRHEQKALKKKQKKEQQQQPPQTKQKQKQPERKQHDGQDNVESSSSPPVLDANENDDETTTAITTTVSLSVNNTTTTTNKSNNSNKKQKGKKNKNIGREKKSESETSTTNAAAAAAKAKAVLACYEKDYHATYVPTPLPSISSKEEKSKSNSSKGNTNKWFPKAMTFKSIVHYDNSMKSTKKKQKQKQKNGNVTMANGADYDTAASICLFYQYTTTSIGSAWNEGQLQVLVHYLQAIFEHRPNLGGRIRVAPEGLNCTLSAADWHQEMIKKEIEGGDTTGEEGEDSDDDEDADGDDDDDTQTQTTSTTMTKIVTAAETLRHFTYDLQHFDAKLFADTDFKFHDLLEGDRHFKDFKILPVQELVFYGLTQKEAPLAKTGIHLCPKDFHAMLQGKAIVSSSDANNKEAGDNDDGDADGDGDADNNNTKHDTEIIETVVIDVRNHYEAAIGRFDGQMLQSQVSSSLSNKKNEKVVDGAEADNDSNTTKSNKAPKPATYVDPKMRKSTDFKSWLAKEETQQLVKNKNVLLYCTGGVRCERASAHLNQVMGDQVKGVYQLQGGVEAYMKEFPIDSPSQSCWRGKNFVFDKREAVSAGNLNGDGGVVDHTTNTHTGGTAANKSKEESSKKKKKKKKDATDADADTVCVCCVCAKPWDRYIGKRKCMTCGVPVLMCDTCMSVKKSNNSKEENENENEKKETTPATTPTPKKLIRCPLCVEQKVTVKASDVEWTDNGIGTHGNKERDANASNVAAPSVLKWGGGHATQKKEKRKLQRRACHFGADCTRSDCFFSH
jgi:predicted sulfurtransferase